MNTNTNTNVNDNTNVNQAPSASSRLDDDKHKDTSDVRDESDKKTGLDPPLAIGSEIHGPGAILC